jgi:phosphatidylserine/phosphatidylglycerophosphate/cardiolipin synthase-like enzyme
VLDHEFADREAELPARLAEMEGVEVRILDVGATMGGVLHEKYFVVDEREAFLGSQNFDWRSLEHILELGVRLDEPRAVTFLADLFEHDWALAGGDGDGAEAILATMAERDGRPAPTRYGDEEVLVDLIASPKGFIPRDEDWDLPVLLEAITHAERAIELQFLSYGTHDYDGSSFTEFDEALRAAAGRGVKVRMILAHWAAGEKSIAELQQLQRVPNLDIALVTVPEHEGGFIPFARVIHAKYMVVDGTRAWLGTSNASGDYFYESRNVGIFVEGSAFATALLGFFEDLWTGPYADPIDPDATYDPPRVAE